MKYDNNALLIVGQLHQHWHRHFNVQDANYKFRGLTAYDLSGLNQVSVPTTHKWLNILLSGDFVEVETVKHRNNTEKKLWTLTKKGLEHWEMLPQSIKNEVYSDCAANWMNWYKKQIEKRYRSHFMKPMFRI